MDDHANAVVNHDTAACSCYVKVNGVKFYQQHWEGCFVDVKTMCYLCYVGFGTVSANEIADIYMC